MLWHEGCANCGEESVAHPIAEPPCERFEPHRFADWEIDAVDRIMRDNEINAVAVLREIYQRGRAAGPSLLGQD